MSYIWWVFVRIHRFDNVRLISVFTILLTKFNSVIDYSFIDCLQKFVEIEELADSERFFCNNCKNKQRSTKKFWVRRLPNVLCLHIKRFRWSPYSRTKLDTHVQFPLKGLDMSSYLLSNLHGTRCSNSGSSLYDLAAVIVHHGSG